MLPLLAGEPYNCQGYMKGLNFLVEAGCTDGHRAGKEVESADSNTGA